MAIYTARKSLNEEINRSRDLSEEEKLSLFTKLTYDNSLFQTLFTFPKGSIKTKFMKEHAVRKMPNNMMGPRGMPGDMTRMGGIGVVGGIGAMGGMGMIGAMGGMGAMGGGSVKSVMPQLREALGQWQRRG